VPANFQIWLDTTPPQGVVFTLAGGAAFTNTRVVSMVLTTTDPDTTGYAIKFWGDVDPAGAGAEMEIDANWVAYGSVATITLSDGEGLKSVFARIRDDVGNETDAQLETLTFDESLPTVTITVDPDRTKISKVDPWDETHFTFTVDVDTMAYKVKVVPTPVATHDQGVQLPNAGGSINVEHGGDTPAETPIEVTVTGTDLQTAVGADGEYTIKVFAQEAGTGYWSV
jgi:hypothetical protein